MKNNDCMINKENRSECSACRLQKCLLFGMKRESIRNSNETQTTINWQDNLPLVSLFQTSQLRVVQ